MDGFKNYECIQRIKFANFHSNNVLSFLNTTEYEVKKKTEFVIKETK